MLTALGPLIAIACASNPAPIAYVCRSSPDGFSHTYGVSVIDLQGMNYTTLFDGQSPPSYIAVSPDGLWLYAAHEQSCSITKIDVRNRSVVKTTAVDIYPQDVAVSPDGKRIYVSCAQAVASNTICVVDPVSLDVIDRLKPGASLGRIVLSEEGTRIFVLPSYFSEPSYSQGGPDGDRIKIINAFSGAFIKYLNAGDGPAGVAFADGGNVLYVANRRSDNLTAIDLGSGNKSGSVRTMRSPVDVAATPDGQSVCVVSSYYGGNYLEVVDTATNQIIATVDLKAYPEKPSDYGWPPPRMLIDGDGRKAYVTVPDAGKVIVVDVAAGRLNASIGVGSRPTDLCLTADGRTLYVACQGAGSIVAIDTAENRVVDTVYQGMSPWDVAFSRDGTRACITDSVSDVLSIVDAATGELLRQVAVGAMPRSVVVSPLDDLAYVAALDNQSIDVVDINNGTVVASASVGLTPTDLAMSRDGSTIAVMLENMDTAAPGASETTVGILDTGSLKMTRSAKVGRYGGGIDVSPDEKSIYVASWESKTISVVEAATLSVVARINGDVSPEDVRASPDGRTVYVADNGGMSLLSIDVATSTIKGRVRLPVHPQHLALTADGALALLSSRDGVAVVDLLNGSVLAALDIRDSRGIAVNPAADLPMSVAGTSHANASSVPIGAGEPRSEGAPLPAHVYVVAIVAGCLILGITGAVYLLRHRGRKR